MCPEVVWIVLTSAGGGVEGHAITNNSGGIMPVDIRDDEIVQKVVDLGPTRLESVLKSGPPATRLPETRSGKGLSA